MISFAQCKFALLYFISDKSFEITDLEGSSWSCADYESLICKPQCKTKIKAIFDDVLQDTVIIQVATEKDHLLATSNYVARIKEKKKWSIEKLLCDLPLPRFTEGRRLPLVPMKVSIFVFIRHFIILLCYLRIFKLPQTVKLTCPRFMRDLREKMTCPRFMRDLREKVTCPRFMNDLREKFNLLLFLKRPFQQISHLKLCEFLLMMKEL